MQPSVSHMRNKSESVSNSHKYSLCKWPKVIAYPPLGVLCFGTPPSGRNEVISPNVSTVTVQFASGPIIRISLHLAATDFTSEELYVVLNRLHQRSAPASDLECPLRI